MSIGLTFTGKIDSPRALLEGAQALARERDYALRAGEGGLKVVLCPLGGELGLQWRPEGDPAGPWLVRGGCRSTPAGAGLHRAAVELLDLLPIRALTVEDETGFYRHRDFQRMKEEHFYPWLRTLVDVCRQESGKGVSGMQLCWDLEQYAPRDIPDTVITPVGRFRLSELVELEALGIEALAGRFFLWNGRTRDARFYRNRAINALWEDCCFAPSARSGEDAAGNAAILDDLERAAQMDPSLPLPRSAYEEVCALAGRAPVLPDGPALTEEFSPGYRRGPAPHPARRLPPGLGALAERRRRPPVDRRKGSRLAGERLPDAGGDGPIHRKPGRPPRRGGPDAEGGRSALGLEGGLRGRLYQAECEVIAGPDLYFITVTCAGPGELGPVAELIGKVSVVSSAAREETVRAQ